MAEGHTLNTKPPELMVVGIISPMLCTTAK